MKKSTRVFAVSILLFIIVLIGVGGFIPFELRRSYYGASEAETFVVIPKGVGAAATAHLLADQGILRTRLPFMLYLRFSGLDIKIKAGEYRFSQKATPIEIAQKLACGDVYFRSITVPEGLTAQETIQLLSMNGFGRLDALERALERTEWVGDWASSAGNLEGYLFPETYRFGHRNNEESIIRTMTTQFQERVNRILKESPLPNGWTVPRVVILASLIEKEVKDPKEMPLVASVLTNRLNKKMPLCCDATIIYAMKLAGTYRGRLRTADLQMPSPYNSYIHMDLPPGPICNPSAAALHAALNPARTDFFYYVSRNDGTHQFSIDLQSHNSAVNKYQRAPSARSGGRHR